MLILAIETATDRCGVALLSDRNLLVELLLTRPRSHAESLVPMIQEALSLARVSAAQIEVVAVSMGPGSYTGLRIGVSTAKGLAFASDATLVGVPSLDALALAVADHASAGDHLLTAFAARRDEVYARLFIVADGRTSTIPAAASPAAQSNSPDHDAASENGPAPVDAEKSDRNLRVLEVVRDTAAVPLAELQAWLGDVAGRLWIAGDAADRIEAVLATQAPRQTMKALSCRLSSVLPTAAAVGRLVPEVLATTGPADLATFEPYYLKEFVAKKPKRTIFDRLPF